MGRYLVVTCRENIAVNKKKIAITHDGGLKYYESKQAAIAAIVRQYAEWKREADPENSRHVFFGVFDVKKGAGCDVEL